MKVAEQCDACVPFFAGLRQASARLLMLDYDGTLAPFTPDRMRAFPYRDIPELISKIMGAANTRVVRQPAPAAEASGSSERSSSKTARRSARAEAGDFSEAAAKAAAPRPRT